MKKVNPYDRSLKILARLYPKIFLSLLIDPVENIKVTVENPEINIPEKRGDYVWRVSDGGEEAYFIFEFQFHASQDALRRAYIKCALLHESCDLPVIGVILYLTRNSYQERYEVSFHGCTNYYLFETIRLWEYKEEIEAGKRKELAPFLILMTDHPDEEVLSRERELIMQVKDEKERANLLSMALTLALRYFKQDWIREYFKEEMAMIKTVDFFQEWIDEGIQQGVQQGVRQGIQQGVQQGIQQGIQQGVQQGAREDAQKSIVDVLDTRFDLVPPELTQLIRQIDEVTTLHKLLRKAVVVESLEKFGEMVKIFLPDTTDSHG